MAAVALLPMMAAATTPAADFTDSGIERLRAWIDALFRALRAEGIAVLRPPNGGGALIFWLQDENDLTSMQMVELTEDVFL
jgi:hypothetical protein